MRDKAFLLAGLVVLGIGVAGLILLSSGLLSLGSGGNTAAERGEIIYQAGTDSSGRPIPYTGGMMMAASCAGCHGSDGRGLRTPMFTSPNVTYRNLTDPAGLLEPDGTRGPTYTDETIVRAVTQGIDAEGKLLAWPMPRWQLTSEQAGDLLAYLKTLP